MVTHPQIWCSYWSQSNLEPAEQTSVVLTLRFGAHTGHAGRAGRPRDVVDVKLQLLKRVLVEAVPGAAARQASGVQWGQLHAAHRARPLSKYSPEEQSVRFFKFILILWSSQTETSNLFFHS